MIVVYVSKAVGAGAVFAITELIARGDCLVALAAAIPLSLMVYATRSQAARRRAQGGRR